MKQLLKERIIESLSAPETHVSPSVALEALTPAQARHRPSRNLQTIWEQLAHVVFWQEFVLATLRGGKPRPPDSAEGGWPPMPSGRGATRAWEELKARFAESLAEIEAIARRGSLAKPVGRRGNSTLGAELVSLADHNTYHFGQIVSLRKQIGAWPPPSGGQTW
jgi:uncharacterized damage-inducible protein DinB